jgi:hypothetical protein
MLSNIFKIQGFHRWCLIRAGSTKTSHGGLSACTTALVTKVAVPKEYLFLKESSKGQMIPVISPTVVTLYSCFTS